jgi:hypothetical protein
MEKRPVYATIRGCGEALKKARSLRNNLQSNRLSEESMPLLSEGIELLPVGDGLPQREQALAERERRVDAEMATCYRKMLHFLGEEANHADRTERKLLQDYILREFSKECVEDQAAVLGNKAISLHDRQFLFATLSTKQKRVVCMLGTITEQDKVAFLEDSVNRLSLQEVQMPMAAVSILSVAALVVCASLILAGPLGGVVAIGSLAVATVLCHYAATRIAQIGVCIHTIQSIHAQLRNPHLLPSESNVLIKKLHYVRKQQLEQLLKLSMMLVMFAVILVTPPPITLSIGVVLLANGAGNYLERYAVQVENRILRGALFGLARLLQLPVALPRLVLTQSYGLGKHLVHAAGLLLGRTVAQEPKMKKKRTFVAKPVESKKKMAQVVVGDSSKEELEIEDLQDDLSSSLHGVLHLSGGHSVLVLFDLFDQVKRVKTYYQQSQERKVLTELVEDIAAKHNPQVVHQEIKNALSVEDLQGVLSKLKVNRTYLSQTLPDDMAQWNQAVTERFRTQSPQEIQQPFLPNPSPVVQVMDAKMALVEAKRYLDTVQKRLSEKGKQASNSDKQVLKQAQILVAEAEMRVKAVTQKAKLVPFNLKDSIKETGALQVESFFHKEKLTLHQQEKDVVGQEVREEKFSEAKALALSKEKPVEKEPANTRH